jgi:hypothetical protein
MPTAVDKTITVATTVAYTHTTILAAIQAIADAVTAAGGPWSVVDNDVVSTNGRQILLKSSDADMANVKVGIIGGVSPNAANIRSSASSTYIYILVHVNHAGDTFDADFNAGACLTGAGLVKGCAFFENGQHAGATALRLVYSGDMLCVTFANSTTGLSFGVGGGGGVARDELGNLLYGAMGSGVTAMLTQWSAADTGVPSGRLLSLAGNAGVGMWLDSADTQVARAWTTISATICNSMTNGDSSKIALSDIPVADVAGRIRGYFKQMRIGPAGKCFTEAEDVDTGQIAVRLAAAQGATAPEECLYLMQPAP